MKVNSNIDNSSYSGNIPSQPESRPAEGSPPGAPPPEPYPTPLHFRFLKAHATLLRVGISYGMGFALARIGIGRAPAQVDARHRRNAVRVRRRILELKGLFIKVGQLISILTNFLPPAFRDELEELQDRVPAGDFDAVRGRIERELGASLESLFAEFDPEAIASASLAQVHRARMHDGRIVAVKVQHPSIEEIARRDLATIRSILRLVERFLGIGGLDEQYAQLHAIVLEELDFVRERENLEAVAANFADDPRVEVPASVPERSAGRILTTTFVQGVKANDLEGLVHIGVNPADLAVRIVEAYCRMIFVDGLYHADPHPGNLLVRPDGTLVFLDFGAVARLSPEMTRGIPAFLFALLKRDVPGLREALTDMGFIPRDGDQERAAEILDTFHERMFRRMNFADIRLGDVDSASGLEMKMEALADMKALDISFRELTTAFRVPKDWLMLERTTLLLIGLCTRLAPAMNPLETLRPYLEENLMGGRINWRKELLGSVAGAATALLGLPEDLRRVLARATAEGIRVEDRELRRSVDRLAAVGRSMVAAMISIAGGGLVYIGYMTGDDAVMWVGAGVVVAAGIGRWIKGR